MGYLYIFWTVFFTVYGQLILKWRIIKYGSLPNSSHDKLFYFVQLFSDPYILSGFFAGFIASIFWMATMTKFEVSYAYPFMGLSFISVLFLSHFILNEHINIYKIIGVLFICTGLVIIAKGTKI